MREAEGDNRLAVRGYSPGVLAPIGFVCAASDLGRCLGTAFARASGVNLEVHSVSPRPRSLVPADRASQVLRDGAIRETMNTVLHLGLRYFGLEVATFSEARNDTLIVHARRTEEDEPPPSLIGPPGIAVRDIVAIHDTSASHSAHVRRLLELGDASYVGAPIVVDGRTVAVVEFTSRKPRAFFNEGDVEMIGSLARWLESELVQATLLESARPPRHRGSRSPAFLASMSKELRSPISSLIGLSKALKAENMGPLTAEQRRTMEAVHESGRHLMSLVNDILALARIESGEMTLEMGRCDLRKVCDAALQETKEQADAKGVRVVAAFDPRADFVRGDEPRMLQIVSTMLATSIRRSPAGGRVGFEVLVDAEREAIRFDVSDEGTTLSDDEMRSIFAPFSEADAALSQPSAGLGIGISLAHKLAAMHGGGFAVERREVGHRFSVAMPSRVSESKPPSRSSWQNLLVMVVDLGDGDSPTFQAHLRNRGHRVLVASGFEEARDLSAMFRPDVVVLEIDAADGDGLPILRSMRSTNGSNLAEAPIVVSASLALPGDDSRFLEAGANSFIARPTAMKQFISVVESSGPFGTI
jgi:signal transduction histidine kinase